MILFERSYAFSSSHLYWRPEWSPERNAEVFGKCALRPAHGHNYRLTVRVSGDPDPETGFVVDLARLDEIVRVHVLERLDHRHINEALPEFGEGGLIPTSENLVAWIAATLQAALSANPVEEIQLLEDSRLGAIWRRPLAR